MPSNFKIEVDGRVFSIGAPVPPAEEFFKYVPSVSSVDEKLLTDPDGINVLKVHWDFLNGLIRKVEGVLEVKAFVVGSPGHDALSPDELRQQLLSKFARDYAKLGYAGESVQFEKVAINGRTWLKCRTPITGLTEFSTGLSSNMYLTVHFSFIDNASERSTEVYRKVDELYEKLVTSMVIAPSSQHR